MSLGLTRQLGLGPTEIFISIAVLWLLVKLVARFWTPTSVQTTPLNGPKSQSLIFGVNKYLSQAADPGAVHEKWASEYGPAFQVPRGLGSTAIVICDPKANAHFYSRETFGYVQTKLAKVFIANFFGRGLLWAEGESHRRQRKALSPAFSNTAIRKLTSVFYDSAYKMKTAWDSMLDAGTDEVVIDVQKWMNKISLDSIGIAGFGHDFGTLNGKSSPVVEVFEAFGNTDNGSFLTRLVFLLGPIIPFLQYLPTRRNGLLKQLHATMSELADDLLARTRREKEAKVSDENSQEKSIIGLLIKAESADGNLGMSQEEITAQNVLLLAGYETTSISLTWALIELSRKLEKQQKLRDELAQYAGTDPTWEQLASGLPYLDAVVHEVLRLHPPIGVTTRVAAEDDVIPFSSPFTTRTGETMTSLVVAKGTIVTSPGRSLNRSEAIWGPTAKEFEPERWLSDAPSLAKEFQGHRHIFTFSDGPRICLGRNFALVEFKVALMVLVRNYKFEFPDGPSTKIEKHISILPRPKVAGLVGAQVPLKVRRVD